jgi:hypothetical protein
MLSECPTVREIVPLLGKQVTGRSGNEKPWGLFARYSGSKSFYSASWIVGKPSLTGLCEPCVTRDAVSSIFPNEFAAELQQVL